MTLFPNAVKTFTISPRTTIPSQALLPFIGINTRVQILPEHELGRQRPPRDTQIRSHLRVLFDSTRCQSDVGLPRPPASLLAKGRSDNIWWKCTAPMFGKQLCVQTCIEVEPSLKGTEC